MADLNVPTTALFSFAAATASATESVVYDAARGYSFTKTDAGAASERIIFRGKAVPASPWSAVTKIACGGRESGKPSLMGLSLHESSTGKTIIFGQGLSGTLVATMASYFTNLSTFSAAIGTTKAHPNIANAWPEWFRISFDGTNYTLEYSVDDKISWITFATIAAASYFTADKVGIAIETSTAISALPKPTLTVPFYADPDFPDVSGTTIRLTAADLEVLNTGAAASARVTTAAAEILNTGVSPFARATTTAIEVLMSAAAAPTRAIDGSKIYEFEFAFQPSTIYNEADWDSIFSRGDRLGNQTMQASLAGFTGAFSTSPDENIDGNYSFIGGNGVVLGSTTGNPIGAEVAFQTYNEQYELLISGFRFVGNSPMSVDGYWRFNGGFGGVPWIAIPIEFDQFNINPASVPGGGAAMKIEFTPTIIPWARFSFQLAAPTSTNFGGGRFGNEMEFKVYHSILDGGDRRSSNGRANKRVTITTSSGIDLGLGGGGSGVDNIIDGTYHDINIGTPKTSQSFLTKVGAISPKRIDVPGEYIQFGFGRKVFMREMVWNMQTAETLTAGEPDHFGKWQWYASNAAGSGFVPIGDPWHFGIGSFWMKAPRPIPTDANYQANSYAYWRMVQVSGTAFGDDSGSAIYQVQFNLIDPDNQSALLECAFTDAADDAFTASITVGSAGSPYVAKFTDADDDRMSATISIIQNYVLTAAFSDAADDAMSAIGSFYPIVFPQTVAIVKGK